MKKFYIIIVTIFILYLSGCSNTNNSSKVADSNLELTHAEAMRLSGYISFEDGKVVGLSDDGIIHGYNGRMGDVSDVWLEKSGIQRENIVKCALSDYDFDYILLDKYGRTSIIKNSDYHFVFEGVKDVFYTKSSSNKDYLTVLFKNGVVWSTANSSRPDELIEGYTDIKYVSGRGIDGALIFTHNNGTVSIWRIDSPWNMGEVTKAEKLIPEVSSWEGIEMAVAGGGKEVFAAGLKSDGTVVATGKYARSVSDWKNIVYIEAACDVLAGLTSDGKVLVVDEDEHTIYKDIATDEVSDPHDWKNIIAISMADNGSIIGLTKDGEIIGALDGSNGEKGIGPANFSADYDNAAGNDVPRIEIIANYDYDGETPTFEGMF